MLRTTTVILAICVVPVAMALIPKIHSAPTEAAQNGCDNILATEPLVVFDVTGGTLLGPVHHHLAVYNDGSASFSRADAMPGTQDRAAVGRAATTNVGPGVAAQFLNDLALAGAMRLCDQEMYVTDVPLNTLTVMKGATDSVAHTFSFWLGSDEYEPVSEVLNNFIQDYFAGI